MAGKAGGENQAAVDFRVLKLAKHWLELEERAELFDEWVSQSARGDWFSFHLDRLLRPALEKCWGYFEPYLKFEE
jgi:hypothetical protein